MIKSITFYQTEKKTTVYLSGLIPSLSLKKIQYLDLKIINTFNIVYFTPLDESRIYFVSSSYCYFC